MEKKLQFYLEILFPHFTSPLISRFSELFDEISNNSINTITKKDKNDLNKVNENISEDFIIYPQKIIDGMEKRKLIIIKGIPTAFGCLNFLELLNKFCNDVNFVCIPGFALVTWEYVYAFVNIGTRKGLLNIFYGLNVIKNKYKTLQGYDFSNLEIYFCKTQNVNTLLKKYQNENNKNTFLFKK